MTVHQHAVDVGTFAQYLQELTARLDPGRGWYGVFTRRDPQGMRSCLDGVEIPPWDVVESLLADLAEVHGAYFAEQVSVRAAALYSASAAAHDRRPGGRQELVHRLELMIREQGRAAERLRTAGAAAGGDPADPEALAWAHDDHRRASARCVELRKRLAAVTVPQPRAGADPDREAGPRGSARWGSDGPAWRAPEHPPQEAAETPEAPEALAQPVPQPMAEPVPEPAPPSEPSEHPLGRSRSRRSAPAPRRKKSGGARFAGLDVDDEEETEYAPSPLPAPPAPPPAGGSAPRGARFGGGPAEAAEEAPAPAALPDPEAGEAVAAAVARLVQLRAEGRSGEAHVVLCEVAAWPAPRLPVLAVALYRAGLAADWTTLLWEASSLPPAGFAAAAGALAAAGRDEDCGLLLRQGVARPAAEVAEAVLALDGAGREGEARALLGAFVRVRTPQEAAEIAGGGTRILPHLLAAAREVSVEREWDLVHALRVAGVPGV
ncbi:hypothetical protein GTY67_29805 [Streptomyces sp. SID8374]|uniref:hypothetical protein n=1 Tax=Streptomyces sp. SID8374 TaxID=2690354 RepID=UPI00136E95E3|nr:hypothetical protein [Streptomyces sp. SID8374]MYX17547.1 hypothetical protein [Streptomyces sp. SID8374]